MASIAGPQTGDHFAQLLQHRIGMAEQPPSLRRELDRAMAAHQHAIAQRGLQRLYLAAEGRLGHAHILRGERDTHAPADCDQATQQIQRRKIQKTINHATNVSRMRIGNANAPGISFERGMAIGFNGAFEEDAMTHTTTAALEYLRPTSDRPYTYMYPQPDGQPAE